MAPPEPQALAENVDPVVLLAEGGREPDEQLIEDVIFSFAPIGADGAPGGVSMTIYSRSLGSLPQGSYRMVTELHNARAEQIVEIGPESELSTPTAVLDAGILDLKLLDSQGGAPRHDAFWELRGPEGLYDTGYGTALRVFPSGEHEVAASLEEITARQSVVIDAGETTAVAIILAGGVPVFAAYSAKGAPVDGTQAFDLCAAKVGLDGKRPYVLTQYGEAAELMLPPGDYVIAARIDAAKAETAFSVVDGQRVEVTVVIARGVAAVSAPGAYGIGIKTPSRLDGSSDYIGWVYGESLESTLPPGDYVVTVDFGDGIGAEQPITLADGQRLELAVVKP